MLHLNPEAKEEIAAKVIETFKEMDRIWVTVFDISVPLNHKTLFLRKEIEIKLKVFFYQIEILEDNLITKYINWHFNVTLRVTSEVIVVFWNYLIIVASYNWLLLLKTIFSELCKLKPFEKTDEDEIFLSAVTLEKFLFQISF
jgi:hypothetical protein